MAPKRWAQLGAVVMVMVGCDSHPLAPDGAGTRKDVRAEQTAAVATAMPAARWLTLRSDGLYDDQGRRRLSRERVKALHIDNAFELHRQAKAEWLNQSAKGSTRVQGTTTHSRRALATSATNQILRVRANLSLSVPSGPRLAVAADDPCFFDARVWCSNELGGELPMASGGGEAGGNPGDPNEYGSMDCSFILASMTRAYAAYLQALNNLIETSGEGPGPDPFSGGLMEAVLQTRYETMQSYLADYNTWKALAAKYKCK